MKKGKGIKKYKLAATEQPRDAKHSIESAVSDVLLTMGGARRSEVYREDRPVS